MSYIAFDIFQDILEYCLFEEQLKLITLNKKLHGILKIKTLKTEEIGKNILQSKYSKLNELHLKAYHPFTDLNHLTSLTKIIIQSEQI